jgi:RHS repeat-associated protein
MGVRSLDSLLAMSPSQLFHTDVAEMNLLCATGLPGAEDLSVGRCLATLDAWARRVRRETDRHLYRFRRAPAEFKHSEGYFRMLMLVTVLQQDFGVRYNPDRIRGIDFRDSRDLFIHGLLEEPHTGTCASMPVLYVAAGRRLGYPLKLVLTHGHIFARWEGADGRDRFNVECASWGMLSFPDEYYKTWPTPLTGEQVRTGRYLMSLGAAEELAVFAESRGHCLLDNGRIREARMAYEHACRLDPLSPGHWGWLDDARVREASLVPDGGNLNTFSNWGCSMTISCLPTADITLSAEPVRTSSLDSTRYRNYHPTLGRWIERDPEGCSDSMSLYGYVQSRPGNLSDPSGLQVGYPYPWATFGSHQSAADWVRGKMRELEGVHKTYEYYREDKTGLKQLINDRLLAVIPSIGIYLHSGFSDRDTGGVYSSGFGGLVRHTSLPSTASASSVFHELIHAYEDVKVRKFLSDVAAAKAKGISTDDSMADKIAYGAQKMVQRLEWLRKLEDEIRNAEPDLSTVRRAWRQVWINEGEVSSEAGERIKEDLGFHLGCAELAQFYNDHQKWPNVEANCIKFICSPIGRAGPVGAVEPEPVRDSDGYYRFGPSQELPSWQQ